MIIKRPHILNYQHYNFNSNDKNRTHEQQPPQSQVCGETRGKPRHAVHTAGRPSAVPNLQVSDRWILEGVRGERQHNDEERVTDSLAQEYLGSTRRREGRGRVPLQREV